jgi:heme-degrading monooxygenase HmoA
MSWNKTAQSFLKLTVLLCAVGAICFVMGNQSGAAEATGAALPQGKKVIARIWHGRVKTSKADEYYAYLKEAGIDKIEAIEGNLGAQVLRRTDGPATEFTVISYWDSREAIKKFAGEDIEKTHFLPKDPQYLLELEPKVKHFEVLYDGRK